MTALGYLSKKKKKKAKNINSGILELRLFFNWFWHRSSTFGNHLILNMAFFYYIMF